MKLAASHEFLESVANDEAVHKWVAQDDKPISLAGLWDSSAFIEFDTGGFIFQALSAGLYEVHTLFLPKSHGVYDKARAAAHFMFCATDCAEIVTKVPAFNVAARRLTEKMGFVLDFSRKAAFAGNDVDYYRLPLKGWMFQEANLAEFGRQFHARLDAAGKHTNHADDPAHDSAVGYALCAAQFGQLEKAQRFYNEWALFAGYEPAQRDNDNTFRAGDVSVRFADGSYELCQ